LARRPKAKVGAIAGIVLGVISGMPFGLSFVTKLLR